MKKSFGILMAVIFWAMAALPAKADVIWEPQDSFYEEYRGDCKYLNRSYITSGPYGKVIVYESPKDATVITTLENGVEANIYYTYTDEDGDVWGIYKNWKENITGWLPMAYMTLIYDYISFEEEFGDRIVEEEGSISDTYAGMDIYFWAYPGSEDAFTGSYEAEYMPQYGSVFVDDEGLKWGYISYHMGMRHVWVLLDKPIAAPEEIYPDKSEPIYTDGITEENGEAEEETLDTDKEATDIGADPQDTNEAERIVPKEEKAPTGIVAGIVGGVIGVTGVLLVLLKKGFKKKEENLPK